MTDNPTYAIKSLQDGGYIVKHRAEGQGYIDLPVFASTTIDEALRYIRQQLLPPPSDAEISAKLYEYGQIFPRKPNEISPEAYWPSGDLFRSLRYR